MIVSVASGKGGTGKTTVATNLALSIGDDLTVQLLDCDVEEPNAHLFLHPAFTEIERVDIPIPVVDETKCSHCGKCTQVCAFHAIALLGDRVLTFPELCHGCGGCTLLCPEGAITEEPREIGVIEKGTAGEISFVQGKLNVGVALAPPLIKAVKRRARPTEAVIIDAPPGTSCPVVNSVVDTEFCLLVTEPTPFGLHDLTLAVGMVRELGVPFGVVINRSGIGDDSVDKYCKQEGIPILLRIPFSRQFASIYAQGRCLVEEFPEWKQAFRNLWRDIQRRVEA